MSLLTRPRPVGHGRRSRPATGLQKNSPNILSLEVKKKEKRAAPRSSFLHGFKLSLGIWLKTMIRMTKKGYLAWVVLWDAILALHMYAFEKCMDNPSLIIPTEDIIIKDSLSYEEIPVQILDRQLHKLRTKEVSSVKVLWRNQFVEEATWETEKDMKKRYPHLFKFGKVPN
ncbi:hypothetical protein MTR67_012489 [Solanum verrucosum]|uniref:Chromo domain-containing protein n=1 Tax=Solanum verrucosum TaxID=315347 RepID=A0AAF0THJ2_SOLVR|nr:hypothetical protein MTR67_012489 [Solanum verrucosum]